MVFMYTLLKKIEKKADNSLMLEKIAELTEHVERLQIEVEVLGK
jgi:hypothetical protein